jgi:hypothetical protein
MFWLGASIKVFADVMLALLSGAYCRVLSQSGGSVVNACGEKGGIEQVRVLSPFQRKNPSSDSLLQNFQLSDKQILGP